MLAKLLQNHFIHAQILEEMETEGEDFCLVEEVAPPPAFIQLHEKSRCPCYGCVIVRGARGMGQN